MPDVKFKQVIDTYTKTIASNLETGDARESTHYSALEQFMESAGEAMGHENDALVEPKNQETGIPDMYVLTPKQKLYGHIEAKDVGKDLDAIEKTEQLQRYRSQEGYDNLILTNYTEWRLYRNGDMVSQVTIAEPEQLEKGITASFAHDKLRDLLQDFFGYVVPKITKPKRLANELAKKAQVLRNQVVTYELKEEQDSPLQGVYQAFKKLLLPQMSVDEFADLYAQTMTYGLFIGWLHTPEDEDFTRAKAEEYVPKDMPLLRTVFGQLQGAQTPETVKRVVDDIATLLSSIDRTKMDQELKHRGYEDDPIIYFYEDFLAEYDPKEREARGVYYTPVPVVRYMVSSVQELLKSEFGKTQGFGDKGVNVLDPATGTATFPVEVMRTALEEAEEQGQHGGQQVVNRLLEQIIGFELMMSSYVLGHFKVDSYIKNDLELEVDQPFRLYLTNTLTNAKLHKIDMFDQMSRALTEQARAANKVKNEEDILVIIGNPPYEVNSSNKSDWILDLIDDYKQYKDNRKERNPKALQDDYVKFFRFAQWKIEQEGRGVLAFISNRSWLENLTFRAMRQQLIETFNEIRILDLHGGVYENKTSDIKDENVFDIREGVAISIFVKHEGKSSTKTYYSNLFGNRKDKYDVLQEGSIRSTEWQETKPKEPMYFLVPFTEDVEYQSWPSVEEIFKISSTGVKTHRDKFVIDFQKNTLANRIRQFVNGTLNYEAAGLKETNSFSIEEARNKVSKETISDNLHSISYRPFDNRYIYYSDAVIDRSRQKVMQHLVGKDLRNVAIVTTRQFAEDETFTHLSVVQDPIDARYTFSKKGTCYAFPLWLKPEGESDLGGKQQSNFTAEFLEEFREHIPEASEEDIFAYIYGVLYTPAYREKYNEFLKRDFPRIPWPESKEQFKHIAELGQQLVDLHLLKASTGMLGQSHVDSGQVERYDYEDGKIWINDDDYIADIPEEVWEYRIGGYQVLRRWLRYRKGKAIGLDEVEHFRIVAAVLQKTIGLQNKLDKTWN